MRDKSVLLICSFGLICAAALVVAGCASSGGEVADEPHYYTARFEVGVSPAEVTGRVLPSTSMDPRAAHAIWASGGYTDEEYIDEISAFTDVLGIPGTANAGAVYTVRLGNDAQGLAPVTDPDTSNQLMWTVPDSGSPTTYPVYERGFNLFVRNDSTPVAGLDMTLYNCTAYVETATGESPAGSGLYRPYPTATFNIAGPPSPDWAYGTPGLQFGDVEPGEGGPDNFNLYETVEGSAEEYLGFWMLFADAPSESHEDLSFTLVLQWSDTLQNTQN